MTRGTISMQCGPHCGPRPQYAMLGRTEWREGESGMERERGARNRFGAPWRGRGRGDDAHRGAATAAIEAEALIAEEFDTGLEPEPEPLLAPQGVEREQWRGYVLICINANVVQVCEEVKERLGARFRGMSLVTGIYDLIVRVEADSREQFKETLILVRETPGVTTSVTLLDLN